MLLIYTQIISKLLTLVSPLVVIARKRIHLTSSLTDLILKPRFVSTGHLGLTLDCTVGLEVLFLGSVLVVAQSVVRNVVVNA